MTTFLLTWPATDMRTGRHGTLVLTDQGSSSPAGQESTLVLTGDPGLGRLSDPATGGGVRLADVECVEITYVPAGTDADPSPPASVVTLHMRDGSAASYRLSRSNPTLLREVFVEAGWSRPCARSSSAGSSGTRSHPMPPKVRSAL